MGINKEENVEDMEAGTEHPEASSLSRLGTALRSCLCPPEDAASSTSKPVNLRLLLWRFCRVAAAFFQGDAKWKARGLMAILLVFAISATGMNVLISYNQRDTTNALTEKKPGEFYIAVFKFIAICAFAAPFFGLYDYVQGLMAIEWRVWLTDLLLAKYFGKKAFFDLKMAGILDNPDQRICEDVAHFVNSSVGVIILLVEKVLNVFAFSAVLWSISPSIVTFLLLYAIVGTYVSLRVFGKKLMWLRFEGLQREADMRYSLVRVRDNVESIAFYRGEHREAASVQSFLLLVVQNVRQQLIWNFGLGVFTNAYNYATFMIPVLALAPSFFSGKIEYGDIVQTSIAFDQIFGAVTIIVLRLEMWTALAAETERLESLLSALKVYSGDASLSIASLHDTSPSDGPDSDGPPGGKGSKANGDLAKAAQGLEDEVPLVDLSGNGHQSSSPDDSSVSTIRRSLGPSLVVDGLTITLPRSGEVLFPQGLSFALEEGQSLLVMGPSGCGKSSLLRVISGLWSTGTGSVQCPRDKDLFFLPQKPYMTIGSLRDQLLFPLAASTKGDALDSELVRVLHEVHLPDLVKRFKGGLDEECDWSDTLSVGEQQRIAFARLLVRRPQMAFLDEATSALDTANERRLYSLMRQHVSSFVSVGHRPSLLAFHTHVLFYDEDKCSWKLVPVSEHTAHIPRAD